MTDLSAPILRPATAEDLPFLIAMLVEAANWDGKRGTTPTSVTHDPLTWHYLEDWPRATDFGVVALDGERPAGAVWARFLTEADDGYGYVSDAIPELTLGVTANARRRGIGRLLLDRLIESARDLGLSGLSLSVEDGNAGARSLYETLGFVVVGRNGNSDTMLLRLQPSLTDATPAPRKWLGPKGGWWVFLGMTVFWLFNVLYDQFALHQVALSPNSLVLGGFGMTGALIYTLAYRLRPKEGISVVRLLLAFLLGGLFSTELAIMIEAPLVSFALASNPHATLIAESLAGVIEELCKIVAVVAVARGLATKTARNGLFLGGAVGLGFAAFEDMRYAAASLADPVLGHNGLGSVLSVTFLRDVFGPFEHPVLTALLAAVLFAATRNGRYRITLPVVGVYLGVSVAHGLIDSLPSLLALGRGTTTETGGVAGEVPGLLLSMLVIIAIDVIWLVYSRRLKRELLATEAS
jgi:RsiW-degrading membrane proteinase PrsW (M82 family)/ribosomal protein S18 acetylase RimI-like enzyme